MDKWRGWNKIQYEAELDPHFAAEVASVPGGEQLYACIQCGTCSGICPLSQYMDYTPRQIVGMIRAGLRGEVLSSYTTWLCSSCYSCTVECPREIKLTDLMYAAKRLAIRGGAYPKRFPIPVLANEFFRSVERFGRSSETWLLVRFMLKTNPLGMFRMTGLGWRLLTHGRLSLKREKVQRLDELKGILRRLEREHMVKRQENQPESAEVTV
ncbi:MAG: 4Fe-4S dicluster domain-containing protein [bacterium]